MLFSTVKSTHTRRILCRVSGLVSILAHGVPFLDVAQIQRRLILRTRVFANLRDLHHLLQLLQIARDQVEERQLVEILRALIRHLHHLIVWKVNGKMQENTQIFEQNFLMLM